MVQFNTRANEILLKLVYYGPGLSGKTTNLHSLHAMCQDTNRGEMFSVNTQEDRTLFFDLLPINLGYIYGNAQGVGKAVRRAYLNNNSFSANVIDDIPNESRLEPKEWGEATVE